MNERTKKIKKKNIFPNGKTLLKQKKKERKKKNRGKVGKQKKKLEKVRARARAFAFKKIKMADEIIFVLRNVFLNAFYNRVNKFTGKKN